MKTIVVSDQHLGYANSDKTAFNRFLDSLQKDVALSNLVLLGDFVDMWRRDASGVFLENHDTVEKLMALPSSVSIHYVPGNHDYHVLRLQSHSYPFNIISQLSLSDGNYNDRFAHGYEYDNDQKDVLMEGLCRVMSDSAGEAESRMWSALTADWGQLRALLSSLTFKKKSMLKKANYLLMNPESRLPDFPGPVEKEAESRRQPNEILVFGHTHKPFITDDGSLVNSGSWVTDPSPFPHNTYVELGQGKARLFQFEGSEITARVPKSELV